MREQLLSGRYVQDNTRRRERKDFNFQLYLFSSHTFESMFILQCMHFYMYIIQFKKIKAKHSGVLRVSIAIIKSHVQKQLGEERAYFYLTIR